jgi:hypothetical protein
MKTILLLFLLSTIVAMAYAPWRNMPLRLRHKS